MLDFETTLAGIDYKLRRILEENTNLKGQVQKLTEENEELKEKLKSQEIEKNNLYKQIDVIKLRNTLTVKGDSTEIKLKINQLIRNIDRSLELLNRRN
jgi:predicted nuclease with TOPRIM domain